MQTRSHTQQSAQGYIADCLRFVFQHLGLQQTQVRHAHRARTDRTSIRHKARDLSLSAQELQDLRKEHAKQRARKHRNKNAFELQKSVKRIQLAAKIINKDGEPVGTQAAALAPALAPGGAQAAALAPALAFGGAAPAGAQAAALAPALALGGAAPAGAQAAAVAFGGAQAAAVAPGGAAPAGGQAAALAPDVPRPRVSGLRLIKTIPRFSPPTAREPTPEDPTAAVIFDNRRRANRAVQLAAGVAFPNQGTGLNT
ncbi:hypothetical protein MKEN_00248500 [Mycena kentingensis (nom. inval.)]|nr:hypothetical protein MKEN_00248500 [Mycena kentingensis (nom. inval.)]